MQDEKGESGVYREIAGGKITEIYEEDCSIHAGRNIILSAAKCVTFCGEENGVTFGDYKDTRREDKKKRKEKNQDSFLETVEKSEMKLESTYALDQLEEICKQLAEVTFHNFMYVFFHGKKDPGPDDEIPAEAFGKLFDDLRKKALKMPEIVVVKKVDRGEATFIITTKTIYITESLVEKATTESDKDRRAAGQCKLFAVLLEEFGHYVEEMLRTVYSDIGGDTKGDEGAEYAYYMSTFNVLKEAKISFGSATVHNKTYPLELDFTEIKKEIDSIIPQFEREQEDRVGNQEYFGTGLGFPELGYFGHRGVEKVLEYQRIIRKEDGLLNWIYLGNYMRDMSQLITPATESHSSRNKALLDAVHKDIRGLGFLDPIKPTRAGLTLIVEILAAFDTMKEATGKRSRPLDAAPEAAVRRKLKEVSLRLLDKTAVALAPDYVSFITSFGEITPEALGVYRAEEHIDNPILAAVFDSLTNEIFFCPADGKPQVNNFYGTKNYIRNTDGLNRSKGYDASPDYKTYGGRYERPPTNAVYEHPSNTHGIDKVKKTSVDAMPLIGGYLPTAAHTMRKNLQSAYDKYTAATTQHEKHKGLCDLGTALHILEDYFAHSNFCELLLIKHGISVYPWVDRRDKEVVDFKKEERTTLSKYSTNTTTDPEKLVTLDQIEKEYPGYRKIPFPDDSVVGFHFQYKNEIYSAAYRELESYSIAKVGQRGLSYHTPHGKVPYLTKIPIVTGYFGPLDMIHSLSSKVDALFAAPASPPDKTGKRPLDMADMLILTYLADLTMSQANEGGDAPKGVDASSYLQNYRDFVYYRNVVSTAIETVNKIFPWSLTPKFLKKLLLLMEEANRAVMKRLIMLLIDSIDSHLTEQQNKQLSLPLGANPSHTQLAKDDFDHPLHNLAASLAKKAVAVVGELFFQGVLEGKAINGKIPTINDVMNVAEEFLSHPYDVHWADNLVATWVSGHQQEIIEQAKRDSDSKKARDNASKTKEAWDDNQKRYEKNIEEIKKEEGANPARFHELKKKLHLSYNDYFDNLKKKHEDRNSALKRYRAFLEKSPVRHRQKDGEKIATVQEYNEIKYEQIAAELHKTPDQVLFENFRIKIHIS